MGVTKKKTIGGPERAKKLSPAESKIKKSPLLKGANAEAERKKRVAQTTVKSRGRQLGSKTEKPSASPKKKIIPTSPVTNPNTLIDKSSETKPTQKVALKSGRTTRTKASKKEDPLTERTVQKSKKVVEASKSNDEPEMNKLLPKAKGKKVLSLKNQKSTPVKKKKKRHARTHLKKAIEQNRGVVYFSHLPHGFYEKELRKYCAQFGVVTGVYLPRSENGNSKGYAFVEFAHPEVAGVVAETMNNYLMMNRLIKAKLVPIEQQKPWLFGNGVQPAKVAQKRKRDALEARERTLTPEEETAYKKRSEQKVKRLKSKLEKKGLSYDFTVVS